MSKETRVTSATGGAKGTKIERFDLIPAGPLRQVAELYGRGAMKYADRNWENGYDWSLSFAAMQRHAWAFWNGEDHDVCPLECEHYGEGEPNAHGETCRNHTGMPHLTSVSFHAFALLEFMDTHPGYDNRPKGCQ